MNTNDVRDDLQYVRVRPFFGSVFVASVFRGTVRNSYLKVKESNLDKLVGN